MLRAAIKTGAALSLQRTGLLRWAAGKLVSSDLPRVVGYHRVVEDYRSSAGTSLASMLISRRMLRNHLEWMARRYRFIPLGEVKEETGALRGRRNQAPIAVTFDDGYRDFYHHAFPVLKAMGIPAGVFVVTSLVDTGRMQAHDRLFLRLQRALLLWRSPLRELQGLLRTLDLARPFAGGKLPFTTDPAPLTRALLRSLDRMETERLIDGLQERVALDESRYQDLLPLTWEMLSELSRAGITIGSHSVSHPHLPRETPARIREEVLCSRQELQTRLGVEIAEFAYPDGQYDEKVLDAVAEAGYARAYTACHHQDPHRSMLTIPRQLFWERSSTDVRERFSEAILTCQMEWVFSGGACKRSHSSGGSGVRAATSKG
jgi:peptidoglycan/xylan/chitin deacetylase (PgdA/CDA1 family)